MSALAFYKRLRAAGVDEATAMLCAEHFDCEVKIAVDALLEPRRAKDRARKANKAPRNSAESTETPETAETLSRPLSPQTPQTPTHTRECVTTRAREDAGFARFWAAYPRKTAKGDARKAYAKAIRKLDAADAELTLTGALERAKAGWVDAQYIPHAATWLNGERWEDEPETVTPRKAHERSNPPDKLARKEANLARAFAGSERASGPRWTP